MSVVDGPLRLSVDQTDVGQWLGDHRSEVHQLVSTSGAVLLPATSLRTPEALSASLGPLYGTLLNYNERSSPRRELGDRVYTSTEYPAAFSIFMHNENSYQAVWPLNVAFLGVTVAATGGGTPLADSRGVLARLDTSVREAFQRRGVMYVRNFRPGIGLDWRAVFQTSDPAAVESYCQAHGMTPEWRGTNWLRVTSRRSAIAVHPETGARTWFNHAAFFHVSTLDAEVREGLLTDSAPEDLPSNSYYGDGEPIQDDVVAHIRDAYAAETYVHRWASGDLLLLDNMLTAHGREPFTGERRVLVAMARPSNGTH
jgi:alpha-ketoglutarate-dependent taurine dioxygenase